MSNSTPPNQRHGHDPQSLADVAVVPTAAVKAIDDVPAWIAPDGHDYGPGRCTVCGGPLGDDTDPAVWPCED